MLKGTSKVKSYVANGHKFDDRFFKGKSSIELGSIFFVRNLPQSCFVKLANFARHLQKMQKFSFLILCVLCKAYYYLKEILICKELCATLGYKNHKSCKIFTKFLPALHFLQESYKFVKELQIL